MKYTTRPLSDRTWLRPHHARKPSQFDSSWTQTLKLLERETDHLNARDLVIECDVTEADLKLNGELRANARLASPAVVVAFETREHGPMLYRCDRYISRWYEQGPDWQQNVRAIALTLEALRAVDRYGATETGQQYTGFKALPAGRAMPASHMTYSEALTVFAHLAEIPAEHLNTDPESLRSTWRRARRLAHPDRRGGDQSLWDQVEQAATVLGVAR